MVYSYRSSTLRETFRLKGKYILIVAICVLLISSFYIITNRTTTFITYTEDLTTELNNTKNELISSRLMLGECELNILEINHSLRECEDKTGKSEFYLSACEQRRDELSDYSESLSEVLEACKNEREEWKLSYENEVKVFESLVKNSIKTVCCSLYDMTYGNVKNWNIVDDSIICNSGDYTVNCATGETNY